MKTITTNCKANYDATIWADAENKFNVVIISDIKDFLQSNNGGYPIKDIICVDNDEYEVRAFLSLDKTDTYYCIEKPMHYFLDKTKSKIIPFAIDSGDNYYCVNNETGKVYYWSAGNNQYYLLADNLSEFSKLF